MRSVFFCMILSAGVACGGDGKDDEQDTADADADTDADSDSDTDADTDADADTDTGAPELDDGHPGWRVPGCWSCHEADAHNDGLDPYECVACHGDNGAPNGHGGDTPCGGCHGAPHGKDGFPDPESCLTCH